MADERGTQSPPGQFGAHPSQLSWGKRDGGAEGPAELSKVLCLYSGTELGSAGSVFPFPCDGPAAWAISLRLQLLTLSKSSPDIFFLPIKADFFLLLSGVFIRAEN